MRKILIMIVGLIFFTAEAYAVTSHSGDGHKVASDAAIAKAKASTEVKHLDPVWEALYLRLVEDSFSDPKLLEFYAILSEYKPKPMEVKIRELHGISVAKKKPKDPNTPAPSPYRIYKNVVHSESVNLCKAYLDEHQEAFKSMEETYGVPKEIVVALLYVETKLGTYLGKENVLWSLSSMSMCAEPEHLEGHLKGLDMEEMEEDWLAKHMTVKSGWAYGELKAFLNYCLSNSLSPVEMPGSVYGAIGICQFMPSNIGHYGVDGDGDGIINLFEHADAIHSTGNYLKGHGWKDNPDVPKQRKVLKRYNNVTAYANTILALGHSVENDKVILAPPDAPRKYKTKNKQ